MDKIIIVAHIGTGGQRGRIYHINGLSPCISSTDYKDATKVLIDESNRVGIPGEGHRKTSEQYSI